MMNVSQIQNLIEEAIAELKDITNILAMPNCEVLEEVLARKKAVKMLEIILTISKNEIQRSAGDKDKLFYLPR